MRFDISHLQKLNLLKQINLLIVVLILLLSCCTITNDNKENKSVFYTIDVESALDMKEAIPLSEIATEISYIPLETSDNILIGKIIQIEMTKSFIFICEREGLYQFTHEGKFIKRIGGVGRGPGEYNSIMHFTVNEKANIIIVQGEFALIWYDINGNYIKSDKQHKFSTHLIYYNPARLACNRFTDIDNPTNLIIYDPNLIQLYKFESQNPPRKKKFKKNSGPLYVYNNNLYFKENYNDTLYCIKDSLMIPHIVYIEKKLLLDKDFDLYSGSSIQEQFEKVKNKLMNGSILESKLFVFTTYLSGLFIGIDHVTYTRILFYKANNITKALSNKEFINNLDNGLDFWPSVIYNDSILIDYKEAFKFKELIKTEKFKTSNPVYSDKKKELEQMVNSLNENDNPILMLVKLKK